MITFTPLSGAARSTRTTPLAYVLQVDDVRILLDCGSPDWAPEGQDLEDQPWEQYCRALREYAPTIDLVLLSHGDLCHSGLYPYAYSRWGLKAPAYTTLPVQAVARIAAMEDVDGRRDEEDIGDEGKVVSEDGEDQAIQVDEAAEAAAAADDTAPKRRYITTAREVHDAFDSVNTLRYSQPTHLQGKCQGLTITPYNAGHTLGGTIWKIRSPSSGTIIYAVNMNHMRERHLDGTVLMRSAGGIFEPLARPDLLITDADRASVIMSRRKDRDAALIDAVTATLSSRFSLLLPCDSSTRVLELLVLLDQHWNYSRLRYPICFLSRSASEMLTFVRSMMEWLGGTVSKEDVGEEGTGGRHDNKRKRAGDDDGDDDALGAFALRFKHLEFFPNPQSLIQKYSSKDPKLILAVPASLSHGPSRHLFCDFAAVPDNVVLLTGRGEEGSLGRVLFDKWNDAQRPEDKWDQGKIGRNVMMDGVMTLKMNSKVPLQGAELEVYLQRQEEAKREADKKKVAQARDQPMLEADEGDSESDSDSEDEVSRELMDGEDDDFGGGRRGNKGDTDWNMDDGVTTKLLSFDIYLKGNVSKATSFFKTLGGQSQRFRTFPYVEKKRKVDEYGEIIDVSMWMQKGKILEEQAESDELKDYRKRQAEEDAKKAIQEPPSKFVTAQVEVQLACRLLFVDMEGLNDGRAVKTIVPKVDPRKLILIHASAKDTDVLIESCAGIRTMTKDIYSPASLETVQIGQQINSFSISISDELLASMRMSRFEDNEVGYLTGKIVAHATSTIPTLETFANHTKPVKVEESQDQEMPSSELRNLGLRPAVPLPSSTMIGELKLTALKKKLVDIGIQAELVGEGVLICGKRGTVDLLEQSVAVRKTGQGKVEMEGNVSEVYYIVRKEIYNLHALIAA
ncbi:beta-lactamase-like protein [Mucidula mucida]|nr:beta-lactamase-like protein [Mucidula mucida]